MLQNSENVQLCNRLMYFEGFRESWGKDYFFQSSNEWIFIGILQLFFNYWFIKGLQSSGLSKFEDDPIAKDWDLGHQRACVVGRVAKFFFRLCDCTIKSLCYARYCGKIFFENSNLLLFDPDSVVALLRCVTPFKKLNYNFLK